MDQFSLEDFNRSAIIDVSCKVKIKNLVANAKLAKVSTNDVSYSILFSTQKKGKAAQEIIYKIGKPYLTSVQIFQLDRLLS
jgi:hypothetical protein